MSGHLYVEVEPTRLVAELRLGRKAAWRGECNLDTGDELPEVLDDLLQQTELKGRIRRLSVRLAPPIVQLRTLMDLPPVRSRPLENLVRTQAGRFFRRNGAPLVTAARWAPGRRGKRPAFAAAIEEPWLTQFGAVAARHGITEVLVSPEARPELELRLPSWDDTRRARERTQLRRAILLAAIAWLGVLAVDTTRLVRERSQLDASIATLDPGSRAVSDVARQADAISAMVGTIQAADTRRHLSSRDVATLVAALPEGAYLTRLEWSAGGGGRLTGAAPSAAAVAAAIEGTGLADSLHAAPAGERVMTPAGEREAFSVDFRRSRRP